VKRAQRLGRVVAIAIAVAAACGACALFEFDVIDIVIVGLAIVAVGLLWILQAPGTRATREWPPPPGLEIYGVRRDAQQLAWSLRANPDELSDNIVKRVRRLIVARLAENGLDARRPADAARIAQLGGPIVLRLARGDWPANATVLLNAFADIEQIPHRGAHVGAASPGQNGQAAIRSDPER
jgi:hypothetical protein